MPTIIDELVVQLKLDPKQFDEAQRAQVGKLKQFEREHERHAQKLSKDTDGITQSFAALQGRLLGIASLFLGGMGIQAFTEHITRLTVQTGYLATSLGIGTSELAKWQGVGATVNATSAEMAQTITSVKNAFSDMKLGRPTGINLFSRVTQQSQMGPPVLVNPANDDPTKFLLDVSRWYVAQKDRGVASRIIQEKLGFGQGTLNALALGPEALSKQLKQMEKYAPTAAEVKNFQDLQAAMATAAVKAEALGRAILSFLTPGVIKFLETISGIADTFKDKGVVAGVGAIDDAAGAANGSAVSGVTGWLKEKARRFNPFSSKSEDGGAETAPGQTGTGVPPSAVPTGPGGSEFLRGRRKKFADALNADPDLRRRVAGMMVSEGARDPLPVVESLMNRADYTGKSLDRMLTPDFYGPMRNGLYEKALSNVDRNPALRARMDAAIDRALAGSNVIGGYTDQGLPTDPNGMHQPQMRRGGNVFTDWGGGPGGHGGAARYRQMIMEGVARENTSRGADLTASMARIPANHPSDAILGGGLTPPPPFSFGGARASMLRDGAVTNNNRSSSTHIGSMNVSVPEGADPDAYARGIRQRLDHYDNVQGANQGLL